MEKLAIVIPAYKIAYLGDALDSISKQTDKRFKVYIGDDNSPEDVFRIVKQFENIINIKYVRFEENLGGKDLVKQWHRCIRLVENEEWIWLFSDDDIMGFNCVECFYKELESNNVDRLYHFNVNIIDKESNLVSNTVKYPNSLSASNFIKAKIGGKISSFVVEYIFNKNQFWQQGGFINFDLAWNSDDATWYRLSIPGGICTIEGAMVKWRSSGINISRLENDSWIALRKFKADIKYSKWLVNEMPFNKFKRLIFKLKMYLWFLVRLNMQKEILKNEDLNVLKTKFCREMSLNWIDVPVFLYFKWVKNKSI